MSVQTTHMEITVKRTANRIFLLSILLFFVSQSYAAPISYQFSVGGFANGGTIEGTFTGEDLDGDGYLSSFIFSQAVDFEDNQFDSGDNEVTFASLEFNGLLDGVTNYTDFHDLTDTSDELFPGFPLDLFFVLNFKLDGDNLLGNDAFEGILMGRPGSAPFVFGLGQFLPVPEGQDFTDAINELPGGASVTSGLILNNSNGVPCTNGSACGVLHSVVLDNGAPTFGVFDLTSDIIEVSQVPTPASLSLFSIMLAAFFAMRFNSKRRT